MELEQKVKRVIKQVKACAVEVYQELGDGWPEGIYHKSMEVALRLAGFPYVRTLTSHHHLVGEGGFP